MSFEDDAVNLFIKETVVQTMPEKLKARHGELVTCQGKEGDCSSRGEWHRRNTAYADEMDNWVFLCDECFNWEQEYWDAQWAEYYSMTR